MELDYETIRVELSNLATIADMALSYDERNATFATLSIIEQHLLQLCKKMEEMA